MGATPGDWNVARRTEFEAWFGPTMLDTPVWDEGRNCYTELCVHMAWKGWQAALESAAGAVSEGQRVTDGSEASRSHEQNPQFGVGQGEHPALREALAELVACKDLKIEVDLLAQKIADDGDDMDVFRQWDEAKGDYDHRAPLAWEAARAALAVPSQTPLTCDQFIAAMYDAGWQSTGDAQHEGAAMLWEQVYSITPGSPPSSTDPLSSAAPPSDPPFGPTNLPWK